MTAKWQMAKETAASVTADFVREVEAKCRRSSQTRDLSAIEPFLGVKPVPLWLDCPPPTANQVSEGGLPQTQAVQNRGEGHQECGDHDKRIGRADEVRNVVDDMSLSPEVSVATIYVKRSHF